MINTEEFTIRLQRVIDYYGETASSFAEKIGVQRSSISHILSGRNKPSLEFVLKIIASFPEVELYWLLNGKGEFPSVKKMEKAKVADNNPTLFEQKPEAVVNQKIQSEVKKDSIIERIVIFYSDGTFKNFQN